MACLGGAGQLVEDRCHGLAADDCISDLIGVLFVRVTCLANAARELHASPLLDHVRGLMRDRVQVGLATKGDVITRRVGDGADMLASRRGFAPDVGADLAQVVRPTKRCLDVVEVGQAAAGAVYTCGCSVMHRSGILGFNRSVSLDGRRAGFRQCREPAMRCIHP